MWRVCVGKRDLEDFSLTNWFLLYFDLLLFPALITQKKTQLHFTPGRARIKLIIIFLWPTQTNAFIDVQSFHFSLWWSGNKLARCPSTSWILLNVNASPMELIAWRRVSGVAMFTWVDQSGRLDLFSMVNKRKHWDYRWSERKAFLDRFRLDGRKNV